MSKTILSTAQANQLNDLGTLDINITPNASTLSKKYWCGIGALFDLIPTIPTVCPLNPNLNWLTSVTCQNMETKGLIEITATWSSPEFIGDDHLPDGTETKSVYPEFIQIPIDDPLLVRLGYITAAKKKQLKNTGHTTYNVGGVRYNYTKYEDHAVGTAWSEDKVINVDLGKTADTMGAGYPQGLTQVNNQKNWMLQSFEREQTGKESTRTSWVWQYCPLGWTRE